MQEKFRRKGIAEKIYATVIEKGKENNCILIVCRNQAHLGRAFIRQTEFHQKGKRANGYMA